MSQQEETLELNTPMSNLLYLDCPMAKPVHRTPQRSQMVVAPLTYMRINISTGNLEQTNIPGYIPVDYKIEKGNLIATKEI
jgi:hypothetical protein